MRPDARLAGRPGGRERALENTFHTVERESNVRSVEKDTFVKAELVWPSRT